MIKSKTRTPIDNIDIEKLWKNLNLIFVQPLVELYEGIRSHRVPVYACLIASLIIEMFLVLGVDVHFFNKLELDILYPKGILGIFYRIIVILSPFWLWGIFQVALKIKLVKQLTEIFTNSGLKSATGKLPSFIFDKPIDEFTRRLRLKKAGQSHEKFKSAKEDLESGLQVFIDEVVENREKGTIDLIYSHTQLENFFELKDLDLLKENAFLVGKGRSKNVIGKIEDTPHLLVAGQTGMGKSTFLRQFITGLYLKNKNYSFDLIDLKGGLEFQIFENLKRVRVQASVHPSLAVLKKLAEKTIKQRTELLKHNDCKDISAFLSKPKSERKYPTSSLQNLNLDRHVVVIDEAFDLFMVGPHADAKAVKESRRHASKIAAQGRAVGVHIVIATQRPDRFAIDPQTKANLTGKVCFRVPNLASSMTVMDNKRAAELPNIKGRAIWQNSSAQSEIQTPFLSEDSAVELLKKHYGPKKNLEKQSSSNADLLAEEDEMGVTR